MSTRQQLEAEWAKASGYSTRPCPYCSSGEDHLYCEHCLGARVLLVHHKVPLHQHWRWHLLAWGMVFFLIACGLLWIAVGQ